MYAAHATPQIFGNRVETQRLDQLIEAILLKVSLIKLEHPE